MSDRWICECRVGLSRKEISMATGWPVRMSPRFSWRPSGALSGCRIGDRTFPNKRGTVVDDPVRGPSFHPIVSNLIETHPPSDVAILRPWRAHVHLNYSVSYSLPFLSSLVISYCSGGNASKRSFSSSNSMKRNDGIDKEIWFSNDYRVIIRANRLSRITLRKNRDPKSSNIDI